jgi:hypothetical protein
MVITSRVSDAFAGWRFGRFPAETARGHLGGRAL